MGAAFDNAYGELVTPALRRLCCVQALFVALDIISFGDARHVVWAEARRRGAGYLSEKAQDDLEDWISTMILKAWDRFGEAPDYRRLIVDTVAGNVDELEEAWRKV